MSEPVVICPNCKGRLLESSFWRYCPNCGEALPQETDE